VAAAADEEDTVPVPVEALFRENSLASRVSFA
jgi:hypothetical protein